jgi:hypothetical protein
MTKYQGYFQQMMEENFKLFDSFKPIHDKYALDPEKYQDEFNKAGVPVINLIHEWESKLCSHSEKGQYGKFSSSLSDKFWNEVRTVFPQIDWVGVTIS